MSKNGAIVILNDLKKKRDDIEDKYKKQKNKKISDKQTLLYAFGFIGVMGATCFVFPTNIFAASAILVGYGMGVPFINGYINFCKEESLKNELNRYNKNIDKLELELFGFDVNHKYIDQEKGFILKDENKNNSNINTIIHSTEEEFIQEENGPKLRLKR